MNPRQNRYSKHAKKTKENVTKLLCNMAEKLKKIPETHKKNIFKLWSHQNKKSIKLAHTNTITTYNKKKTGRGFVIGNTIVDGLTSRIKKSRQNFNPKHIRMPNTNISLYDFIEREIVRPKSNGGLDRNSFITDVKKNEKSCKCENAIRLDAMKHGSMVHEEMYVCTRYILRLSGILSDKRMKKRIILVDKCTKNLIISLQRANLIPFSSEWPAGTTESPGCATAIDLFAFDIRQNWEKVIIEIKTGSIEYALSTPKQGADQWHGVLISMWQLLVSYTLCKKTYGTRFFNHTSCKKMLIHARPWGSLFFPCTPQFSTPEFEKMMYDLLMKDIKYIRQHYIFEDKKELYRSSTKRKRNDVCLRSKLPSHINRQSKYTSNGKLRKKAKQYKTGF